MKLNETTSLTTHGVRTATVVLALLMSLPLVATERFSDQEIDFTEQISA